MVPVISHENLLFTKSDNRYSKIKVTVGAFSTICRVKYAGAPHEANANRSFLIYQKYTKKILDQVDFFV